jgi:hypothetical protein
VLVVAVDDENGQRAAHTPDAQPETPFQGFLSSVRNFIKTTGRDTTWISCFLRPGVSGTVHHERIRARALDIQQSCGVSMCHTSRTRIFPITPPFLAESGICVFAVHYTDVFRPKQSLVETLK